MSELRDLYQEVILDHNKHPRNFHPVDPHSHEADGYNPLCGDRVHLELQVDDNGVIESIGFQGDGCAISTASASIMTEALKGHTVEEAKALFERFRHLVTEDDAEVDPSMGKVAVLAGVREFPMRVKCATLAWHTFDAAIREAGEFTAE
ncbi:Zinc-dependent sulfurtransferase SufU [wastewater metagenome]|uniref:Zinc-dependent sulfurtransferase SufU n=2 Tax=unclassified sequences TaxID=12908 RepID=A0A5B8RCR5_9ZZZZ|nr:MULTISPECIES: SUF system NifU family Fe-S cluster assembly protein [Arhodomonas]MCS4502638.1 SUF system NifU family Fe-S cluster assembly protein [Arhodomonas aquaeolei]QEA05264.1 zinc-dependent sulfurtransferase SufU [uncultured organism]